jgi:hypothetical protein
MVWCTWGTNIPTMPWAHLCFFFLKKSLYQIILYYQFKQFCGYITILIKSVFGSYKYLNFLESFGPKIYDVTFFMSLLLSNSCVGMYINISVEI